MSFKTKGTVSGNNLQPSFAIENDGFGLLTSRVVFRGEGAKIPAKGEVHPEDGRLKVHRTVASYDAADIDAVTVDYVGIEQGLTTEIQWSVDYASSTLPIQSHPNFFKTTFGGAPKKMKDLGWNDERSIFPSEDLTAEKEGLVGIRSYLAPEVSISGLFYTNSKGYVQFWINGVGKTFQTLPDAAKVVLPTAFQPISINHDRFSLLTGVGYEMFADLYKVSFQARCASGGWHKYIYDRAQI